MAADIRPQTFFGTGYRLSGDSTAIEFTTADEADQNNRTLPNLTNAEADPVTGEARKVLWALFEDIYQRYYSVDSSAAAEDKITQVRFQRSISQNSDTGNLDYTYRLTFYLGSSAFEVADEY